MNGDLWEYMKIYGTFHEGETHYMFKQMCKAMAYCHRKKIVHRDLKCENILLDENLNIKIGGKFYYSISNINPQPYAFQLIRFWSQC